MRLAILTTHPIQYYAPVFACLARMPGIKVRVFYGWKGLVDGGHDREFGQAIKWDIPLLDGYEFEFVENISSDPGTHHFRGIDLPCITERIEEWKADALLVYGWSFRAHLKAMRYFYSKIPVYFRGDSTLLDKRTGLKFLLRWVFLRWVYGNVNAAIYVGTHNRNYFAAMGLSEEQLIFAPHAIDNERFEAVSEIHERDAIQWRSRLGIPNEAVVFLQVGKLDENKAPHEVLSAFQSLGHEVNAHLIFAGSGEMESQLREIAGDRVHFIGFQNQTVMPTVYRLGDLLLMPSRSETWGLAVNEAMACSRAVALSDRVGCAVDLVETGKNGWMFSGSDSSGLREVLRLAVSAGPGRLRTMGACSASIIQRWSLQAQARAIYEAVNKSQV